MNLHIKSHKFEDTHTHTPAVQIEISWNSAGCEGKTPVHGEQRGADGGVSETSKYQGATSYVVGYLIIILVIQLTSQYARLPESS
jgi:hypothetical protein